MRWTLNCILLASIAVISATEDDDRTKRDLSFFKNLLSGTMETAESSQEPAKVYAKPPGNYRLYRIPGFEKVLVKAIPKGVTGVQTPSNNFVEISESSAMVAQNPNIAIVNSYLGTSQLNETLLALQGVKNLLQSGVLEARRQAEDVPNVYPRVVFESGKVLVDEGPQPYAVGGPIPIPIIEGYRPVEIERLPDLPTPTKYSYKQVNGGGVTTYSAKDNKNVIVTETNRPVPLPPYVTYRIQEVMSLGERVPTEVPVVTAIKTPPAPIPVYNVPKVHSIVTSNRLPVPQVFVPRAPNVAVEIPNSYSYQNIHNGGSVTTYTGSGEVLQRHGHRPVVVTEVTKPVPLPPFISNRIEKVAASAIAVKVPNRNPHGYYETPVVYKEAPPVIIEERPTYVYDHVNRVSPVAVHHYNRPLYREDVNIHFAKHKNNRPAVSSSESGKFSYKTVHEDGSVTTYSDNGVHEEGHKGYNGAGAVSDHAKYPGAYSYQNIHHPHLVREEICIDPPTLHYPNVHSHVAVHPQPNGYSYNTLHGDGSVTTFSGAGYVEQQSVHPIPVPMVNPSPPFMVPELVTPEEFFKDNTNGPQKLVFAQPVMSQYVYKQVNHNNPTAFTATDAFLPADGQVNVKVGDVPVPKPYLSPPPAPTLQPATSALPVLPSVTPESYVYVPPSNVNAPSPTSKPAVESQKSETGHSFTHITNEGVHTNKGGVAAFESTSMLPVVSIQKTSSSTTVTKSKSPSKPKFIKTVKSRVTTTEASHDSQSLSANPIVVLPEEQTFSFKQDRSDGSSITVVGNKDKVSVIEGSRSDETHRGDIPSSSF